MSRAFRRPLPILALVTLLPGLAVLGCTPNIPPGMGMLIPKLEQEHLLPHGHAKSAHHGDRDEKANKKKSKNKKNKKNKKGKDKKGDKAADTETLAQGYGSRDVPKSTVELDQASLPDSATKLGNWLLIFAANGREDLATELFTDDARWGLPDTRELAARPIAADPQAFFEALGVTMERLPMGNANCPVSRGEGLTSMVRNGAEPYWCSYGGNGPDKIQLKMVMRQGVAKIDYVGLWEDGPQDMQVPYASNIVPGTTPAPRAPKMPQMTPAQQAALKKRAEERMRMASEANARAAEAAPAEAAKPEPPKQPKPPKQPNE